MKPAILLLLGMAACATTPSDCRSVGVDVPQGAAITGAIVAEHIATEREVMAKCQSPFALRHGCALAVNEGQYEIWSVDNPRVLAHERCHALYELKGHP